MLTGLPTFDENLKLIMFNDTTPQGNLEGEEKSEEELVTFVQAPC